MSRHRAWFVTLVNHGNVWLFNKSHLTAGHELIMALAMIYACDFLQLSRTGLFVSSQDTSAQSPTQVRFIFSFDLRGPMLVLPSTRTIR